MKSLRYTVCVLLLSVAGSVFGDDLPDKPNPPRLVNDFANMLTPEQQVALEQKLNAYNDSTSTQIAVVTISDLKGYDVSDFAQRLGQKWGVGGKQNNNGIMMLIKPKTAGEKGEVWISTGYGMEEHVTDAATHQIVNQIMIPEFQQGNIYAGVDKAVDAIIGLNSGTYKADLSTQNEGGSNMGLLLIPIFIVIFILLLFRKNKYRHFDGNSSSSGSGPVFFPGGFLGGLGGGGGFSGGGGGGFGGFGGGSFGGGGAGGSW